jgi:hypothetical protein
MNYKKIYNLIIENRKQNLIEGYSENHHIIPRCLGGSNDANNLIKLSAREHFICHYLLAKMYPKDSFEWYKTNHAFLMMKISSSNQDRYFNSKLYELLRKNFSFVMSAISQGSNNSQYGTMWICNIELQENKKINKEEDIPDGWIKGKNVWKKQKECLICKKSFISNKRLTCSDSCLFKRKTSRSQLNGREYEFLNLYITHKSINKSLKIMGFCGSGGYYLWAKKLLKMSDDNNIQCPLSPTSVF